MAVAAAVGLELRMDKGAQRDCVSEKLDKSFCSKLGWLEGEVGQEGILKQ